MATYPTIDGHFWVERDGKIIDPYFKEYDMIKSHNKCVGDVIHLPSPDLVQKIMIKKFNSVNEIRNVTDELFLKWYKCPLVNKCFQNARLEILKNGGKLIFGSMGWKKKSGEIHYEYGGENWSVAQHLLM